MIWCPKFAFRQVHPITMVRVYELDSSVQIFRMMLWIFCWQYPLPQDLWRMAQKGQLKTYDTRYLLRLLAYRFIDLEVGKYLVLNNEAICFLSQNNSIPRLNGAIRKPIKNGFAGAVVISATPPR